MATDTGNSIFQLAVQFVNQTGKSIFLTGKAGTGKTTFLRYIREHTFKKLAVVAPTGVAAINAGGTTMHSFFQLPFGPFIPTARFGWNNNHSVSDPNSLFANIRFNANKRLLLQELELLIIDEVSMVRADMLDAVDHILRHFRLQPLLPFGGVQVVYIGDLFQLPPVVSKDEWELLQHHYSSPFFFDAQVLKDNPPVYLELTRIYRQNEATFIDLLNNIRNNQTTYQDLEKLHDYYQPEFMAPKGENYITLTSHNAKAEAINQQALENLRGPVHAFEASVTGEFSDKAFPADKRLQLKEGAQIMMIKNDKGESRRFFNGKIGIIERIINDKITITFPDDPDELTLEKEVWKNIRYNYNKEKDKVEEEELGTFSQYPIRLAWAITIHKSQGLTFEKAVIDAGQSFAPGQVYVALSRLTALTGLVLRSRIQPYSISTDERVIKYTNTSLEQAALQDNLKQEQLFYISSSLLKAFNWDKLVTVLQENLEEFDTRQIPDKYKAITLGREWLQKALSARDTAVKFIRQLEQLLNTAEADSYTTLGQRMQAGSGYFTNSLQDDLLGPLQDHMAEMRLKLKTKKYVQSLQEYKTIMIRMRTQMEDALKIVNGLQQGVNTSTLLSQIQDDRIEQTPPNTTETEPASGKPAKGETNRITLELFRQGSGVAEIATKRGLALTTVESHLASFISTGELDIKEVVSENKIGPIIAAIKEVGGSALGPIKSKLGDRASFGEIRAVMNYLRKNNLN